MTVAKSKEPKRPPKKAKEHPMTEDDFDSILRQVTRKVSQPSQSDSAK